MALSRVHVWASGETLTASDLNAEFNSILNNPATLISGVAPTQSNLQNQTVTYCTVTGTANVIGLTCSPAITAYAAGQRFVFIAGANNTGATTVEVSGLGAKNLRKGSNTADAFVGGELIASNLYDIEYDGTRFQLMSVRNTLSEFAGFKNACPNGDFDIWQRGAGGAASIAVASGTTAYTVDRWYIVTGTAQNHTISQQAGLTSQSRWSCRVQRDSGQTGAVGALAFGCPLDLDEVIALRGRRFTLSATISTGADWSPTSGQLTMGFNIGTGAAAAKRSSGGGFTADTQVAATNLTIAAGTAAARYSVTGSGTVSTSATQGEVYFVWTPVGTASTNDWFQVDEVQLEVGPAVTFFDRRPIAVQMTECQRHYQKSFPYATAPAQSGGVTGGTNVYLGTGQSGTNGTTIVLPVVMRTTPSVTTYNPSAGNANVRDTTNSADRTITVGTLSDHTIPFTFASGVAASTNVVHWAADAGI